MTRDQAIEEAGQALAEALAELQRNGVTLAPAAVPQATADAPPTVVRPRRAKARKAA